MTRPLAALAFTALIMATLPVRLAHGATPATHPFGGADWQSLARAVPRAVAPDGRTILVTETHGRPKGTDVHVWYALHIDGSGRRVLHLPKSFEPFGFAGSAQVLYGTLDVKGQPQLARWTIGGRAAHVIARIPSGIGAIVPSNDGARYALLADPRPLDPLDTTRTVVTNDESALYVVAAAGGKPVRWCPLLDQIGGLAWAPDDTRIAVLSQTPKIGYHRVSGRIDLCSATASRKVARIDNAVLNEIPYPGAGIAWADGGRDLAFLSTTTDVITPDHLWTVSVTGSTPRDRTPNIRTSILALRGDPHGNVWTTIADGVQTEVGRYHGGVLRPAFVLPGGVVDLPVTTDVAAAPATLAFGRSDPAHATNVAVAAGGALRQLTHAGDATLARIPLGRVIRHRWTSADGTALEAIVTFPPGASQRPGKFLVFPHGGPEANDELGFDALARIIAARGYVVMQPEYRGSTGYGSAHLQAIYQHFGDTAYRDVDAATTEAIAQGWADPKRLAIFGWSAGGFMTSWTVTQTARYRAAVEGAGITEWLSFIMSSDVQQTDYDARSLAAGAQPFLQYSAVMFADRVTTPLLILHGAADVRVPTYQGRELFVLLKERGKTVRMVTYPGSPHFPRRWEQRRNVVDELTHWLDRYNP
jgi:dipeptidyl aminopeptidase/acylaminoacyl peptidase